MKLKIRISLALASTAALAGIIYLSRNLIRTVIVQPLFNVAAVLYQSYLSLPQPFVWAVILIIGVSIALVSTAKGLMKEQIFLDPKHYYPSRVETWEEWLDLANEGELYRLKLARELGFLTLTTIANREAINVSDVRRNIINDIIPLPEKTKDLLAHAPKADGDTPIIRLFRRFSRKNNFDAIQDEIDTTIQYLEAELEVHSG